MNFLDTRYGSLCIPDTTGDLIGRFIATYGEWAHDEVRFVAGALPRGPVRVLDVGSFVGTFGIGLTSEADVSSVVFVEANPLVVDALRTNVETLLKVPASVVEAAVVPDGRELTGLYHADNLGSLSFADTGELGRVEAERPARFVSLLDLSQEHGGFDLIKMDVEGLERSILEAAPSLLEPGGPSFWLECNEDHGVLDLADLLLSAGLTVHFFAFPAFAPDNFRGELDQIFPWAYESGLWASRGAAPALPPVLIQHKCILRAITSREDLRLALWQTPRWGKGEWKDAPQTTLVAEAAHAVLRHEYHDFMATPPRPPGLSFQEVLKELELSRASEAKARDELRATQLVLGDVESALGDAEVRLQSLEAIRAVSKQYEVAVASFKARLEHSEAHRIAIEKSTYWRIGVKLRKFLSKHPKISGALRAVFSRARRMLESTR